MLCSETHRGWNVETITVCGITLSQTVSSLGTKTLCPISANPTTGTVPGTIIDGCFHKQWFKERYS